MFRISPRHRAVFSCAGSLKRAPSCIAGVLYRCLLSVVLVLVLVLMLLGIGGSDAGVGGVVVGACVICHC